METRSPRALALALLGLVGAGLTHGCGGCARPDDEPEAEHVFRIAGSDTELALVQALAERYRSIEPDISISVAGGGSGVGIAALIEGRVDVANASRPATEEERAAAGDALVELQIAIDSVAVIVNETLGIGRLSVEDLGRIYRGEITRWDEVGGPDRELTLYGRQTNSGTYAYFREAVLAADYSPHMLNMNGNAQIVEAVRNDHYGIGYVGVGYAGVSAEARRGITLVAIEVGGEAFGPLDHEAVAAGRYPISRPLFQYTRGDVPPALRRFLAFELSHEGQDIVRRVGFLPLEASTRAGPLAELEP